MLLTVSIIFEYYNCLYLLFQGCSTGVTNCPYSCVDYPVICAKCSSGYTATLDKTQCGMNCSVCDRNNSNCNSALTDDGSIMCFGQGAACWVCFEQYYCVFLVNFF